MCGRYVIDRDSDALADELGALHTADAAIPAHFNIPPTSTVPVVIAAGGRRRLGAMRWGIPGSRDGKATLLFNSRLETLVRRPARSPYQRCLVPATGYYEWRADPQPRQAFLLRDPDRTTMTMAGIYEAHRGADGVLEWAFAIVTTAATGALAEIHHRRPVVVAPDGWDDWLDGGAPMSTQLRALDARQRPLASARVGPLVGDVRNNEPALLEPVGGGGADDD